MSGAPDVSAFRNEPTLELRRAAERERLTGALRALDARLPLSVPVVVGGRERAGEEIVSVDPGEPARVVARAASATADEVDAAIATCERGFGPWAARAPAERVAVMRRATALLRDRRLELAALCVRECAKPWPEADADVCEAIDFLEFYADEALRLAEGPALAQVAGERNELRYAPRGVVAVIAPWNFPIAIPCGMTAAALVTGNAAVLKPAEQAPGCASELCRALWEAGVPADALALLPGEGEAGARLVRSPAIQTIAFTGSAAVGLEIIAEAGRATAAQRHLKRCVVEMGGKNCIIVDSDADLDDAVGAIVESAYAYAGQKCSAASRVLAHRAVHDGLAERLAGAVAQLRVGPADAFDTDVPPLIDAAARERIDGAADLAARTGRVLARTEELTVGGFAAAPALVGGLPADSPILRDELFGPFLAIEPVASVDAACDVVDSLPQALTGGLLSRNPDTVRHVIARSPVGNLYVNRNTTGAMVGRQPFGGNRLSGTGTKAGGPGYLLHFVEPRAVTENTVRHGLVV